MQSVESKKDELAIRRTLLATGLGAAFGFQGWRLALVLSMPWYGAAWMWLGHVFLGLSIGITAGMARWWKRGITLGLAFGVVSTFGTLAMGFRLMPYGISAMAASGIAGILTALIADAVYPPAGRLVKLKSAVPAGLNGVEDRRRIAIRPQSEIGRRLARKLGFLEDLERERKQRRKPAIGKLAEERIVWSELLDLELQDIDERLKHIGRDTGEPSGKRPQTP